jgi:hypothetical protein
MRGYLGKALALAALSAAGMGDSLPAPMPRPRKAKPAQLPSMGLRVPNGRSFRSLRQAINSGWEPPPVLITAERKKLYLHSHARAMAGLREILALGRGS